MNSPSSKIDLSKGLSIYAVCKISSEQKRQGRKVIMEFKDAISPVKLTLGLNKENNLALWIIDNNNKNFKTDELNKDSFLDKETLILVSIYEDKKGKYKISLYSFYDKKSTVCDADLNLTGEKLMEFSVGATVQGTENAAFSLKELILRNTIDEGENLNSIVQYFDKKHSLNHV